MTENNTAGEKNTFSPDKSEYEIVPNQKLRHLHCFLVNIVYRNFHFHGEIEIFAVVKGRATIRRNSGSTTVEPGSIVIFNSNEAHEVTSDSNGVTALVIQLSNHFLNRYFPQLHNTVFNTPGVCSIPSKEMSSSIWKSMITLTMNYIKSDSLFELRCVAQMCRLLELLISTVPNNIINESDYLARKRISQRMERLFAYIDANYQYPIRLSEVAEAEGITPTHLSHFFSENFGVNFQQYLNNIRFEHAVRLMDNRTMSISDIAAASGFSDLKYMTRMFMERFGCKPRDFRENLSATQAGHVSATPNTLQHRFSPEDSMALLDEAVNLY